MVQPLIGRLSAAVNRDIIMVECMNLEPRAARLLSGMNRNELLKRENEGREVLVVFANGNPDEPVIIGMLENVLENMVRMETGPVETIVDGERVVIQAENEIVLTCGAGSITISKDGKIIVKGTDIVSRASQSNKIKGSSVELN